ncbi:MAG: hypothetical protein ABI461_10975 [Polyangiaceae bacterium]
MLELLVGRSLDSKQRIELEKRLERCLGPVSCVRHPPAIDSVKLDCEKDPTILVSACCELTSRRAKILVAQVLSEFSSF